MSGQGPKVDRATLMLGIKATEEIERRKKQRKIIGSLEEFAKAFWHIVEPRRPLIWGWHLTLMCRELERSYRGQLPGDLVINIPPRHSKSSFVGVLGPAWWWLHQPECQFLAITKADKNAKRDARHMRRVVDCVAYRDLVARQAADGRISEVWDWSADQNEVRYFANTAGGHRISMTTDTDVTGAGADILIIDDPHDAEEMGGASPERGKRLAEEVWEKFQEVWATRLNPGGRTQCIMQRLLAKDLAGRFLERPDITALVLPLEYESAHPHCHPEDQRTVEGEVLAEGRFSPKDLQRLKATPSMFAGQAQQRPSPKGGGQIKREWFRKFYRMDPRVMAAICSEIAVTVDAARKASVDADFHSMQVWGRLGARRILLDRRCERLSYPQFEKVLDGVITLWRPGLILIEDTANGTTYLQCRDGVVPMVPFHPNETPGTDKSKPARAIYVERAAEANQIELPDPSICSWIEEWIYNITSFPTGLHDDDMDAASQLMMRWSIKGSEEVVDALAVIQARTAALRGM